MTDKEIDELVERLDKLDDTAAFDAVVALRRLRKERDEALRFIAVMRSNTE